MPGPCTDPLLNFVPFLGWMVNLAIGFVGMGAVVVFDLKPIKMTLTRSH
ncbi:hypothetical protein ACOI1H_17980 [Loktanella sp. DJP18]